MSSRSLDWLRATPSFDYLIKLFALNSSLVKSDIFSCMNFFKLLLSFLIPFLRPWMPSYEQSWRAFVSSLESFESEWYGTKYVMWFSEPPSIFSFVSTKMLFCFVYFNDVSKLTSRSCCRCRMLSSVVSVVPCYSSSHAITKWRYCGTCISLPFDFSTKVLLKFNICPTPYA